MTLVGKLIHDPDTESLIRKYLNAGAMVKGKYEKTTKGTPQGGNLLTIVKQHHVERARQRVRRKRVTFRKIRR